MLVVEFHSVPTCGDETNSHSRVPRLLSNTLETTCTSFHLDEAHLLFVLIISMPHIFAIVSLLNGHEIYTKLA